MMEAKNPEFRTECNNPEFNKEITYKSLIEDAKTVEQEINIPFYKYLGQFYGTKIYVDERLKEDDWYIAVGKKLNENIKREVENE